MPHDLDVKPSNRLSRKHGGCAALVVMLWLLLPIGYVLSYGPAFWLCKGGYLKLQPLLAIYAPLGWVADRCQPLNRALIWYENL